MSVLHTESYFIEIRLFGRSKKYLRELITNVAKKNRLGDMMGKIGVPHVSLIGPLETPHERRLLGEIGRVCVKYDLPEFKFKGFGKFQRGWIFKKNRVIFAEIEPSSELESLRSEIIETIKPFCKISGYDSELHYHATIAFKNIDDKFGTIWKELQQKDPPAFNQKLLRLTILGKGRRIVGEFDFLQRRMLTRREALNRENLKLTRRLLQQRREGDVAGTSPEHPFEISPDTNAFVISDTHFDHDNIIRYCNRPFGSVSQMNDTMVRNWNQEVERSDVVFFLGDLAYGRNHNSIDYWLGKLNGKVYFVRGNHDLDPISRASEIPSCFFIRYRAQDLMLTHDPLRPTSWKGWMVHGDKHNNSPSEYPSVNRNKKTMNVCVEMIDYKPLPLNEVVRTMSRC